MSPFPGQTYPTISVTGTPSAVKPFRNERAKATGPREPANDTDLELGDLTVKVARHEALTQQFDTVHPIAGKTVPRTGFWPGSYLDAASAVNSAARIPSVCSSIPMWILRHTRRFVPPCLRLRRANSPPDCLLTLLSPLSFAFDLDPPRRFARTGGTYRLDVDQQVQRAC